jgi:putative endonuclease
MGLTQIIGAAGERAAAEWLEREEFEILARNWREGRYELDIVARRGGTLHFIEVKTRDGDSWESPEDAMTAAKQRSFRHAVTAWLTRYPSEEYEPQLDLIAVDTAADGSLTVRYIPEAVISRW